jgi:coniferyl-aldehyde dehydrogenase
VAGVISPWNYPVQLALAPAVGALAAATGFC